MNIIVVGGSGTIGRVVCAHLGKSHHIITASRHGGEVPVDITDARSIRSMFESTAPVDAVVCIAGDAKWAPLGTLSEKDFYIGLKSKLMGQVNLVRIGCTYLTTGGSFTLSTGILADDPVPMTTSAALVNGGIHSFVKAAALELPNGMRINAVSSGLVEDAAEKYQAYFPGHKPIPMQEVINGYVKRIEGRDSGQIIRIYHN